MIYNPFDFFAPFLNPIPQCPPTLYSVLQNIVNGNKDEEEEQTEIKDLAKEGRHIIFNFDYDLTDKVSKETFETTILNHYIDRRIGFQTMTLFRIKLNTKMTEIMPVVNMLFDSFDGWNLFKDGEVVTRTLQNTSSNNASSTMQNTSSSSNTTSTDNRFSELPQDEIQDIEDGSYMTDYRKTLDNSTSQDSSSAQGTSQGTSSSKDIERIERSNQDKVEQIIKFQKNVQNVYNYVYSQLDDLFYSLV